MNLLALFILYMAPIFVFVWMYHWMPRLAIILTVAYCVRVATMCFGFVVSPLPESQSDALVFEAVAWEQSQGGFSSVLSGFKSFDTYFISWLYSWPYLVFGREVLFLNGINIVFGTATVWLCWYLSRIIFGGALSYGAAWACALYPTLILYSAVTLREVFVTFGLLVASIGILKWFGTTRLKYFALACFGFLFASFFHGAMLLGVAILGSVTLIQLIVHLRGTILNWRLNPRYTVLGVGGIFLFATITDIQIPKIGFLFDEAAIETLFQLLNRNLGQYIDGSAAYPSWMTLSSIQDVLLLGPLRILYFIGGPLPWDVISIPLLVGCVDGMIYLFLLIGIVRNIKSLQNRNFGLVVLVLVLASYVLVFGLGVSNFGVGYRHRAKLLPIIIALYFGTRRHAEAQSQAPG